VPEWPTDSEARSARRSSGRGILFLMLRTSDLSGCALDGRYELHALIGEGAFGRVYRGFDRRLARPVAVKVIKPWWAEDSAWVERFQREAQLLARVSDPGIVQVYDIGHAAEGPYYVAELVEGESLAERLRHGSLGPDEARAIAEQLCHALASAHAQKIVHCDVKPANVLLTGDGKVKVGDFGVARLAEGTSQALSATVAGTPRYMSPEQARGQSTGPATDVYSAGVVLYEMLTGRPPFEHGSAVELGLRHVQEEPPRLPSRIPASLRDVVERALAKDPTDRYLDGAAMAAALEVADSPGKRPVGVEVLADGSAPSADEVSEGGRTGATLALAEQVTVNRSTAPTILAPAAATKVMSPGSGSAPPPPPGHRAGTHAHRPRQVALLAALLALGGGALAVLLLTRATAHTSVPELRGLPRGGVDARARRLHVSPEFSTKHSSTASGIAIAQDPSAGTRVKNGSVVHVVLSSGPPPVTVPGVVGQSSSSAESLLAHVGLRYAVTIVAAPGSDPNVVTHQSPPSAARAPRGSTVALSVAEVPRWRALTTFSGVDDGESVPFRILGDKWKVTYSMAYEGSCTLLLVCFGPSAAVKDLNSDSSFGSFKLGEGETEAHTFENGPGLYRMMISGGHDSARWSMTVEDYY
jgi:serine/threonine protein kinase